MLCEVYLGGTKFKNSDGSLGQWFGCYRIRDFKMYEMSYLYPISKRSIVTRFLVIDEKCFKIISKLRIIFLHDVGVKR